MNKQEKEMRTKKSWTFKAKEHYSAGKILYEKGFYRDSLARLYYCAYSLMVAECGKAPKGRWEHKGIVKCFLKKIYDKDIEIEKEYRELLKDFYELRRIADYGTESIEKEDVETYIKLVKKLFEVVEND